MWACKFRESERARERARALTFIQSRNEFIKSQHSSRVTTKKGLTPDANVCEQPSIEKTLGESLGRINLAAMELPFKDEWSSSLENLLVFKFCWTVSGLEFRPMHEDVANRWNLTSTLRHKVDVPLELVRQGEMQTSVKAAASIDSSQRLPVVMEIRNKLKGSTTPNRGTQVILRISSGFGQLPNVAGDFGGQMSAPTGPGAPAAPEVSIVDNVAVGAFSHMGSNSLKASEKKTLKAYLSLPTGVTPPPGSLISSRAEYWHEGTLAEYGPPATMYVAHPLPSNNESAGARDVVRSVKYTR